MKVTCMFHVVRDRDGNLRPEKTPSCGINLDKEVFGCFSCGQKGSFIRLKSLLDDITYKEAKWQLYKGRVPQWLEYSFLEEKVDEYEIIYAESQLAPFSPLTELLERGIMEEEAKLYGLLKDKEDNIYLPIRDKFSCLRGCQVRYTNQEERYGQYLRFSGGGSIFGEHLLPKEEFRLIICEGGLDAVKLYGVLGIYSVAIMTTHLGEKQASKISALNLKEIILWLDNDIAGRDGIKKNYNRLKKLGITNISTVVYKDDPKDPSDTSEERIRELYARRKWIPEI